MKTPQLDMVALAWEYVYANQHEFKKFAYDKAHRGADCVDVLKKQLDEVERVMATNFAACPDYSTLVCAVSSRAPLVTGGGVLIESVCKWLWAKVAKEVQCVAPTYISCDYAVFDEGKKYDRCTLGAGCPFCKDCGTFV